MTSTWQTDILFSDNNGYEITNYKGDGSKSVDWHSEGNKKGWLEVCLNLQGRAEVIIDGIRMVLNDRRVGLYDCSTKQMKARRNRGYDHQFSTISLNKEYLQDQLSPSQFFLKPAIRSAIFEKSLTIPLCTGRDMVQQDESWLSQTDSINHVSGSGKSLWMQSKVMEYIACNFFKPDHPQEEMFCDKIKRHDSDRIIRTKLYLEENYAEHFDLQLMAQQIGCSASYLSRLFSKETGSTIKSYLRSVRIRKARKLLTSGKANVTEAAYDCGYNSLSHFAKAFHTELGYNPSEIKG